MKIKRFLCGVTACLILLSVCPTVQAAEDGPVTLKVGFFEFTGYHILLDNGKRSGYGYDFLQKLAMHTD